MLSVQAREVDTVFSLWYDPIKNAIYNTTYYQTKMAGKQLDGNFPKIEITSILP